MPYTGHSQPYAATTNASPLDDDEIIVIRFLREFAPDDDVLVIIDVYFTINQMLEK